MASETTEREASEREVARCSGFDVAVERGMLMMYGSFDFDGSGQGFGYCIDGEFIRRFINVFRVERLRQVDGRYCWVTHTHSKILLVEPMLASDGEAFDVATWALALQRRGKAVSP